MIKKLIKTNDLSDEELISLLKTDKYDQELRCAADTIRQKIYGKDVYLRGLIEISNYCKKNCFYCGIRSKNHHLERYRLKKQQILTCCDTGYKLGFRTFVLQGGEDPFFDDEILCDIINSIKSKHNDCAITLSLGEKSFESYQKLYDSGCDRYLLRHETANEIHYSKLHPKTISLKNRKKCLFDLKKIGYQTGSGFMVGSPYQTIENLIEDLRFLQELKPAMIGIGPYLKHKNTPFADFENGSLPLTLRLISILRLLFPYALIPATTALGTISPTGREEGLKAGANVVMPNLSPVNVRNLYNLYDNKICTGDEAAECKMLLQKKVEQAGYEITIGRGDAKMT